jgi:hypothetical protein
MNFLKKALKKTLAFWGYELHPSALQCVSLENFANLAQAYEQLLNAGEKLVEESEVRPRLIARLLGTPPSEAYAIVQAIAKSRDVAGDVCEFGVAQGETSALIAHEILSGNKILHLFDSFEGLPAPTEKDQLKDDIFGLGSMEAYAGEMAYPEQSVRDRLQAIAFPPERFVIHKGFIEQVLGNDPRLPEAVSFAYLDFDFYEPIKVTLDFLHRTSSVGSIIIVDDYDYFSTGVKTAVDEFLSERNSAAIQYECFVPESRDDCFAVLTRKG